MTLNASGKLKDFSLLSLLWFYSGYVSLTLLLLQNSAKKMLLQKIFSRYLFVLIHDWPGLVTRSTDNSTSHAELLEYPFYDFCVQ